MFSRRRQFLIYLGLGITSAGIATIVDREFQNATLADPTTPSSDRTNFCVGWVEERNPTYY